MAVQLDFEPADVKKLFWTLVVIIIALVSIYLIDQTLGPIREVHEMFDLDAEGNVPSWFSSTLLFLVGLIFFCTAHRTAPGARPSRLFLGAAALLFAYLSVDEAAAVHEHITWVFDDVPWVPKLRGGHAVWLLLYLGAGAVALIASRRQLLAMLKQYRRETIMMAVGIALYAGAAAGLEVVKYQVMPANPSLLQNVVEVALEESAEMLGASITLCGAALFAFQRLS
ncbi:MAG: hypothetical protein V1873_06100 [Verrucomicrobiota bacterium]